VCGRDAREDLDLLVGARTAEADHCHESVGEPFGERVRARHGRGVLRRDEHERRRDVVGDSVDGDVTLLEHLEHLEQRRLRPRVHPVELVEQHDVGQDSEGANVWSAVSNAVMSCDRHATPDQV